MAAAQWADALFWIDLIAQTVSPGTRGINYRSGAQANSIAAIGVI